MRISRSPVLARAARLSVAASLLTFASSGTAVAQTAPPAPVATSKAIVIPDGTELTVVTTEALSSKTVAENDPITLKVDEAVTIDNSVVIPKGAVVKGVVSEAKAAGRMGKGGKLNIRIESTTTIDGQKVPLRAAKGKEGNNNTGSTVAMVVLFGPLGLLRHGNDAAIKAGTALKVYTDAAVTVNAAQ